MSWQVGCFALLGCVLAGGFVWYERSRPPSQVVALVAAMAALAVAGRLVLAPIPNMVATTDIVLFTGYAIGAGPGFATGALAGLVSNFWLGQGPWTPWQMAGWGLVGVLGAVFAHTSGRRMGRIQLAVACGFAGVAYGALLNFSLMVTYGGEFSLDRFVVLSVRAIPFDLAHAIGNITIALIAGPALVRMLTRFRERFEVKWTGPAAVATPTAAAATVALLLAVVAVGSTAPAPAQAAGGPGKAAIWLQQQQNADGGYGASPGASSNVSMTGWAALGLEAAGVNPLDVSNEDQTPITYLRRNASSIKGVGDLERTILVLAGAGANPRSFGGRNLVSKLNSARGSNGSYQGQVNLTAFGVLAMRSVGAFNGVTKSRSWLRDAQNSDGGWGFTKQAGSDADTTGAVMQAVSTESAAKSGVKYLRKAQHSNGGFSLANGGPVNSQSTAWAVQGLIAAGVNPGNVKTSGRSPMDYLAGVQSSDGHYRYSAGSNQTPTWVTGQALLATERKAFPLSRVPRDPSSPGASATSAGASTGVAAQSGSVTSALNAAATKAKAAKAAAAGDAARQRLQGQALPAAPPAPAGHKNTLRGLLRALAAALVFLLGAGYWYWRRRRARPSTSKAAAPVKGPAPTNGAVANKGAAATNGAAATSGAATATPPAVKVVPPPVRSLNGKENGVPKPAPEKAPSAP